MLSDWNAPLTRLALLSLRLRTRWLALYRAGGSNVRLRAGLLRRQGRPGLRLAVATVGRDSSRFLQGQEAGLDEQWVRGCAFGRTRRP